MAGRYALQLTTGWSRFEWAGPMVVGEHESKLSVLLVTDSKGSLWAYQVAEPFAQHACHLLPLPAQLDLAISPRAYLPTVQHADMPQGKTPGAVCPVPVCGSTLA
jgi:hypothetical protein